MRSLLIVVQAPITDFLPGVSKILEPMFIQTLIAEFSVKALDVTILNRLSRLDQLQLNAMMVSPLIQCSASIFRPLIGSDGFWVAAMPSRVRTICSPEIPIATGMSRHSLVKSSTIVRHLILRPLAKESMTKSIDHV